MSDKPKKAPGGASSPLFPSVLICAVGLNAAGAMIVEIVAGRILAPYFGMSLYTWTTVIGVVLAGLAAGHWIGGRLSVVGRAALLRRIGLALWAGAAATLLILPAVSLVAGGLAHKPVAMPVAITLTGFAAFFVPSLLAGLVQPLATTLALHAEGGISGPVIGRMLAAGAVGSIAGTFLCGFLLVPYLGSAGTVWLVAALNACLGALFVPGGRWKGAALGLAVAAAALLPAFGLVRDTGFELPCTVESRYFCIRVDPADELTGRPSRLMALDHLVHSVNDEADPQHLFSPYLHLVDEMARARFATRKFSAFFIGGGGYTLPRAWLQRHAAKRITVAEIDPAVTRTARESMYLPERGGIETVASDARVALARENKKDAYDIVFGDAFRDISIPAHLVTDEFNVLVRARLAAGGFYVVNVVDSPDHRRLLASIVKTLQLRFPVIEVWVSPGDILGEGRATFIVYASDSPTGLASNHRSNHGINRAWARIALGSIGADELGMVLTDDHAPVDRLLASLWRAGE